MHLTALVRLRDSKQNSGGIEFRVSSEVGVSFDPGLIGDSRLLAGNQFPSLTLFHCSFCHSSFLRRQKRVILIYWQKCIVTQYAVNQMNHTPNRPNQSLKSKIQRKEVREEEGKPKMPTWTLFSGTEWLCQRHVISLMSFIRSFDFD